MASRKVKRGEEEQQHKSTGEMGELHSSRDGDRLHAEGPRRDTGNAEARAPLCQPQEQSAADTKQHPLEPFSRSV